MIERESLATYLTGVFRVPVDVRAIRRLGGEGQGEDPKGFGYGVPLEVECVVAGGHAGWWSPAPEPAQGFGHDYPADRAWQALYGHTRLQRLPPARAKYRCGLRPRLGRAGLGWGRRRVLPARGKGRGPALLARPRPAAVTEPLRPLDTERARALARLPRALRMRTSATSPRSTTGGSASWSGTANA